MQAIKFVKLKPFLVCIVLLLVLFLIILKSHKYINFHTFHSVFILKRLSYNLPLLVSIHHWVAFVIFSLGGLCFPYFDQWHMPIFIDQTLPLLHCHPIMYHWCSFSWTISLCCLYDYIEYAFCETTRNTIDGNIGIQHKSRQHGTLVNFLCLYAVIIKVHNIRLSYKCCNTQLLYGQHKYNHTKLLAYSICMETL